jgi:hypothetical protein
VPDGCAGSVGAPLGVSTVLDFEAVLEDVLIAADVEPEPGWMILPK